MTNSYGDTVSVVDTTTNDVVATIADFGDAAPRSTRSADGEQHVDVAYGLVNPTVTPDGRHVYVAKSVGGGIAVIDVASQKVTDMVDPGGPKPSGLAFTPDGERLVVTLLGETVDAAGGVTVIDCTTGAAATPVPVGGQPERVALSPDGRRAYVVSMHSRSMWVLDVDAREIVAETSPLGELPFNVLVAPGGDRVYVGVLRSNCRGRDRHAVARRRGRHRGADAERDGVRPRPSEHLRHECVRRHGAGRRPRRRQGGAVGRRGREARPPRATDDGSRAYFVRPFGETVSVMDTQTLTIVDTIAVDKGPTTVAIREAR